MRAKIFIDGGEGTTGLKILERFDKRDDVELIKIDENMRKNVYERKRLINLSDYTFLCLPDVAAIEAVSLIENPNTRIIDASTAHRTDPHWAYGFPELSDEHRAKIAASKRVSVPGCYASGFVSMVYPLVKAGIIAPYHPVVCHAVSGYSGAGKKGIAEYESENKPREYYSPRQYALNQNHKHLNEMRVMSGLSYTPMFNPIVDDYYSGMVVSLPLITRTLAKRIDTKGVHDIFASHYEGANLIKVMPYMGELPSGGFLAANTLSGKNGMEIFIFGNDEQILITSRLDNLGKGASGAAVQCLNIMMGIDETTGLL